MDRPGDCSAARRVRAGGPWLRGIWLSAVTAAGVAAAAAPAAPPAAALTVPPGVLVRWAGADITECGIGTESFAPLDGACWLPVDLLAQGSLQVSREVAGKRETKRLRIGAYPYPEQRITIEDDAKVNPRAADLARIEAEQKRVAKLWSLRSTRRFTLPLGEPLETLPPGGRFGARRVFNGQPRSPHGGVDYAARAGTTVRAAAAGIVALAEDQFFAGKAVYLDHGDGLITMYFHLSALRVKSGEQVAAGQTLGTVGATGRASGPHLHWAARWRGARVDPEMLLRPSTASVLR